MYGGLMAENATQAAAADILRRSLVELDEMEWPVVGHTHDELLLEVETDEVDEAQDQLRRAMLHVPDWAEGLPLNCELWTGRRYRK
jgi:DNA polymerase bacteriophage-type